ncbi:acetoin utilization protein AcuB [Oxalobacteraceae bacterium GrIS 2.11]
MTFGQTVMPMELSMDVANIMSTHVVSVELDDTLAVVKEIFENLKFHHLLVLDEGKLLGVISDRDLLKALSPNLGSNIECYKDIATLNKRVHQVMTRHPIVLDQRASVADAVALFNTNRISCIPIVDEAGKPVGIVSWRDVLKNLLL